MTNKTIQYYTHSYFLGDPVGQNIDITVLTEANRPEPFTLTSSAIVSYDESTGVLETDNVVYVPAPSVSLTPVVEASSAEVPSEPTTSESDHSNV